MSGRDEGTSSSPPHEGGDPMTGLLDDTAHERADGLPFEGVDVDAVVQQERRRVHQRRVVAGIAGAALLVAALAVGVAIPLRERHRPPPVEDLSSSEVVYAVGRTLHVGERTVDVGHRVHGFVLTADGIVYADRAGSVYAWDGQRSRRVGSVADPDGARLVADEQGRTAAWLERHDGGLRLAVLDLASGRVSHDQLAGATDRASVRAAKDGVVYVYDGRRLLSHDVASAVDGVIDRGGGPDQLQDVAGGLLLHVLPGRPGHAPLGLSADRRLTGRGAIGRGPRFGDLSPDGRHWTTADVPSLRVFDSSTGRASVFRQPGPLVVLTVDWLDDDRILALTAGDATPDGPASFLLCRVSTVECRVVATVPHAGGVVTPEGPSR